MDEDFFGKNELYEDLYFVTKGQEKCNANHSFGPMIREYYLIHVIVDGEGYYQTGDSIYKLEKGQYFVIFPDEITFYQANNKNPWKYAWIGFDGEKAEELLNSIEITRENPVGYINQFDEIVPMIKQMAKLSPFTESTRMRLQGMLYKLLSHLFSKSYGEEIVHIDKINKQIIYTHDAIELIKNNYRDVDFKIGDLSRRLALNESYLTSTFKQMTGQTLQKYLIDFRIQKSRHYLETTDYPVKEVSEKVGYRNPLSFTRVFKQKMGMTPSEYKKKNKSKE